MLAAVPSTPQPMAIGRTEERPASQPSAAPAPKVPINSLSDIADLCTKNRDPKLKALLRSFVRLVKLDPGRLEINLPPDAPKSIVGDLQRRLEEWTETRWMVILSREKGDRTLAEVDSEAREARLIDAKADPDVAAILSQFPGARITDVRIRVTEDDETEEVTPPATIETDEGDILPGDDMEF